MSSSAKSISRAKPSRTLRPNHAEPKDWFGGYILLPCGEFYEKTKEIASAHRGDVLRFFNGGEYEVVSVLRIRQDAVCDALCRMRYGIPWKVALARWQSYAVLEGNDKHVISTTECLLLFYGEKVNKDEVREGVQVPR